MNAEAARALFQKAMSLFQARDLQHAAAACMEAQSRFGELPPFLHLQGLIQAETHNFEAAQSAIKKAIALQAQPDFFVNLARIQQAQGHFDEAINTCEHALQLFPQHAPAMTTLATQYLAVDRNTDALEVLTRALQLQPDNVELLANLGGTCTRLGQFDRALKHYRHALNVQPDHPVLLSNAANALLQSGDPDAAMRYLQKAIAVAPDFTDAQVNLATVALQEGQQTLASEQIEKILSRESNNRSALALRAIVYARDNDAEKLGQLLNYSRYVQQFRLSNLLGTDDIDSITTVLADLADLAGNHLSLQYEPESKSTRRGYQSSNLLTDDNPMIRRFANAIAEAVEQYKNELQNDDNLPLDLDRLQKWNLNIWSTVLENQGHQQPHIHPAGLISGVCYVQIPETIGTQSEQGWIEFGRPPAELETDQETHDYPVFQPEEGLMILFPSYFYHRTLPFAAEKRRISIAFDVIPAV